MYEQNTVVAMDLVSPLVENSVPNFKALIGSKNLSAFDEIIFQDKIHSIREAKPIQFEKTVEANFRKIRATRLRILGYKWNKFESRWEI